MASIFINTAAVLGCIALVVIVLSAIAPTRVEYTEEITIAAPIRRVFDDIRMQERLMRWSAWPKETKSQCSVDTTLSSSKEDGALGVQTVFFTKGKRFGHQEVTKLVQNELVSFTLEGGGPPHFPTMDFTLTPIGASETRVELHFVNRVPPPFNAIWKFAGLSKWTRSMHLKDLTGLKAFSEPPHIANDGETVDLDSPRPNPFEISMPGTV
ncbi:MAG: SRPBCC family protein [Pseudomonadota bacterium]